MKKKHINTLVMIALTFAAVIGLAGCKTGSPAERGFKKGIDEADKGVKKGMRETEKFFGK